MPTRRRVLTAVAAAALAGCASPDFDYSNEGAAAEDATAHPTDGEVTPTADGPVRTDGANDTTGGANGTATATGQETASGNGAGDPTTTGTSAATPQSTALSTPAFEDGGTIPERFTADGVNVSPPLTVRGLPDAATVYALLLEDLDIEEPPFTHWLVWNVAPGIEDVPAGLPREEEVAALGGARQGTNDFGTLGYRGPAPPASDPPHSYRFAVLALEEGLSLPAGADRSAFDEAVSNVVLGGDDVVASYVR